MLLNILAGKEDYDGGTIVTRRDANIAILEQAACVWPGTTVIDACFSVLENCQPSSANTNNALPHPTIRG